MAQKSREEGEIGSESREKGDLPLCSPPLFEEEVQKLTVKLKEKLGRGNFLLILRRIWRHHANYELGKHTSRAAEYI